MITKDDIRAMMIKHPSVLLWDKNIKSWTGKDKKLFITLFENKPKKRKMRILKTKRVAVNAIKVMRISDGEIYGSISECQESNTLNKTKMRAKLKAGTEFKTLN